jgi:hypothetical protein
MADPDDDEDEGTEKPDSTAKDELFEALDHFKNAAEILFRSASKDPVVQSVAADTGKVVKKIGATAEPLARQLAQELGKMTKQVAEAVSDAVEGRKGAAKKSRPPDAADDDDDDDPPADRD